MFHHKTLSKIMVYKIAGFYSLSCCWPA